MRNLAVGCAAASVLGLAMAGALAQENYESWPLLRSTFPSTGGGGIMIKGYDPVIVGSKCVTTFMAVEPGPDVKVHYSIVEFDATPAQGGNPLPRGQMARRRWQRLGDDAVPRILQGRCFPRRAVRRACCLRSLSRKRAR
jgi:hypothetical protein